MGFLRQCFDLTRFSAALLLIVAARHCTTAAGVVAPELRRAS